LWKKKSQKRITTDLDLSADYNFQDPKDFPLKEVNECFSARTMDSGLCVGNCSVKKDLKIKVRASGVAQVVEHV
jgi:hypothetical protein